MVTSLDHTEHLAIRQPNNTPPSTSVSKKGEGNHQHNTRSNKISEATASYVGSSYIAIMEAVIATIGQETDRVKVLTAILPYTLALSESEVGALLVVGDDPHQLIAVVKQGLPDELHKQVTEGDWSQQLLAGQRLWVETQPLQLNAEQALLGRHKLKYLFGLPLQFGDQVLGAVLVGTCRATVSLLREELERRLVVLAQLTALFLDDVRLRTVKPRSPSEEPAPPPAPSMSGVGSNELEELLAAVMSAEEEVVNQNTDLGVLNALSHEVSSTLQLSAVLETAIKQTQGALGAETGWCYLFEDEMLILYGHRGLSERYVEQMQQLKPGTGAEGMAFSRNEPILRDALLFHSGKARTMVKEEGLVAVAAAPLEAQGKTFGVLAVGSRSLRTWTARDERMLMSIGRQVAQAISNSRTFVEVQAKAQNWEANYNALQQANAQLSHRAELLEKQIQELRQAEKQIWFALAASNEARRCLSTPQSTEELAIRLRKVLVTMSEGKK